MSRNRQWNCPQVLFAVLLTLGFTAGARAQDPPPPAQELQSVFPKKAPYSPYADRHFPQRVYWGDTHLHTSFSMDAGAFGCRLGPRDAYRFARGQEVTASSGQPVRLSQPLDFLVVADHSVVDIITSFGKGSISKAIFPVPGTTAFQGAWEEIIKAAEEANDPGRFTAFIGFEWTSNTGGNNLHRNILFQVRAIAPRLSKAFSGTRGMRIQLG